MEKRTTDGLALRNTIATLKQTIAGIEHRIAAQRELQKHARTEDLSITIRLLEAELPIYRIAIEQMEARLQESES
jgi:hypothetical protein